MTDPLTLADYEHQAARALAHRPWAWDYYQGGSEDEVTLRANRTAFEQWRLRPRMLVDVSSCDLRTSVLGFPIRMPILIAPTAGHGLAHPEAECATARAARSCGTLLVASTQSTCSLEEIAQAAQGFCWSQLYVESAWQAEHLVKRAEAAGYRALVLTVDTPQRGNRERDLRNQLGNWLQAEAPLVAHGNVIPEPEGSKAEILTSRDLLTWQVIPWLRSLTRLPLVLKGILTAEDALLAVSSGVDGIIVSNHGGRQLDGVPASIEALPEVVKAVDGRCEVYMDGGIRRGTDILKALALGAHTVLIGRPALWGLAVNGTAGVKSVLEILRDELERVMALSGCPALGQISRGLVSSAKSR